MGVAELNDRLANDVRINGTSSSGTDDDRVLRALERNKMCWLRYDTTKITDDDDDDDDEADKKAELTECAFDLDGVGGLDRVADSDRVLGGHPEVVAVRLDQLRNPEAERAGVHAADRRPPGTGPRRVAPLDQVPADWRAAVRFRSLPGQRHRVPLDRRQTQASRCVRNGCQLKTHIIMNIYRLLRQTAAHTSRS